MAHISSGIKTHGMRNVGFGYSSQDYNTPNVTYLSPHSVSQANHQPKKKNESEEEPFQGEEEHSQSETSSTSPPGQFPQHNYVKNRVGTTKKDSLAFLGLRTRGTWCKRHIRSLYYREARKRHPDKNPDNREEATLNV